MTKYKACCGVRCLVIGCEIKDNGGCHCACSISDTITSLESVISGIKIAWGPGRSTAWIPDRESRQKYIANLSKKSRDEYFTFRKEEAPKQLIKMREKLAQYVEDEMDKL